MFSSFNRDFLLSIVSFIYHELLYFDSFRLPKDFVARIQDLSDNADSPDIIMDEDAKEVDNDKKSANADKDFFPLPKEAIYHNQAAILVKFVSNFLIQLELISSPTTVTNLVGKKIFASRNRFYTREGKD